MLIDWTEVNRNRALWRHQYKIRKQQKKENMQKQIQQACIDFLKSLDSAVTHSDVFYTLAQVAESQGYTLKAEQRGINGTFIHFVEEN